MTITSVRKSDRTSDYPSQGLAPDTLGTIFKEADLGNVVRQAELFEEMEEKDTHLSSILQTRKLAVTGIPYKIEYAEEDQEEGKDEVIDFVSDMLRAIPDFEEKLLDVLDAIGKGYSCNENMWRERDGAQVVDNIKYIHPKKAVFYNYSEMGTAIDDSVTFEVPRIKTKSNTKDGIEVPPYKMIYFRYKARSGYDTRAGILRVCSWMYLFKNYSLKDWAAFCEVYGMPFRLGIYPAGAGDEEITKLLNVVRYLGADAAGVISEDTKIEWKEAIKGGSLVFKDLATMCNKEMSKAVLGQTSSTEAESGGSGQVMGGVSDRAQVRADLKRFDCRAAGTALTQQLIRPIVGYNFGWDKPVPNFLIKIVEKKDLKALSEVYKTVQELGYDISAEQVEREFGIPRPKEGETILEKPAAGGGFFKDRNILNAYKTENLKRLAAKAGIEDRQLDGLIINAIEASAKGMAKLAKPLQDLIKRGGSLTEIRDTTLEMYKHLDADDLEDMVEQTMIVARLFGRATIQGDLS